MAKLLKLRRGTTTQHGSFTGAEGEVTVDTDKETLVVHDGSTAGGHPVAAEDMANVSSASIAGRLGTDSIATSKIAAGALPTDVTVASANIVDGTIATADIADGAVTAAKIASQTITADRIAANAVGTSEIIDSAVTNAKLATDSVTGSKIAAAAVNTSELADSSVTTAKIANDAINGTKIADDAVGNEHLADNCVNTVQIANLQVTTGKIADGSVTAAKLASGAADLLADTSPQLGGDLASNSHDIKFADNDKAVFGTGEDLHIYHDGSNSYIKDDGTGDLLVQGAQLKLQDASGNDYLRAFAGGAVYLHHAGNTKFETTSAGVSATGAVYSSTGVFGVGASNNIDFTTDNRMSIHINGSEEFRFESDGDFHADGDVYAFSTTTSSDENLKKDITIVGDAISKVEALKGVTFKWKKNDADSAGVIAQDVEKVLPEVVRSVNDPDGNTYKAVNYAGLTSILIEAVKDLSARVKALEAK